MSWGTFGAAALLAGRRESSRVAAAANDLSRRDDPWVAAEVRVRTAAAARLSEFEGSSGPAGGGASGPVLRRPRHPRPVARRESGMERLFRRINHMMRMRDG